MPTSPCTEIPHIEPGGYQKEVTHDEAIDQLDRELNDLLVVPITDTDIVLAKADALFCARIRLTGPQTGDLNLIVPDNRKKYTVEHAASGAFSVTVKPSAGSGIALVYGETRMLYCDGVDVVPDAPSAMLGDRAYDIVHSIVGKPADGALIVIPVVRSIKFLAGFASSKGRAITPAAADAVFSISKNGIEVGTVTMETGATFPTFDLASDTTIDPASDDWLGIGYPSPQDADLADLGITLAGIRV